MGVGTKSLHPIFMLLSGHVPQGTKNLETDHAFSVTLELVHLYTHRKNITFDNIFNSFFVSDELHTVPTYGKYMR